MPVTVVCPDPDCGASYSVADSLLGRRARCRKCGRPFALAAEARASAPVGPGDEEGWRPPSLPSDLTSGSTFGRYRVVRRLGRGGMGSVYLAHDIELDRPVALKVPHVRPEDGPDFLERFRREARAAAQLAHPNICRVYDVGQVGGVPFLTMDFVEGRPLSDLVAGPMAGPGAARLVRTLALALGAAHARGVIHRDLKPSNVMIREDGTPILMDFGLARRDGDARLTASGAALGTPAYMPPEQVRGDAHADGPRSDVYSLGVILYELLAGRRPFEGPPLSVLALVLTQDPPPPSAYRPGLDPRLAAICLKAMAKDPAARYASMGELAAALADALGAPAVAPPPGPTPPAPRVGGSAPPSPSIVPGGGGRRRRLWIASAAALAAALLLGVVVYVATDRGRIKVEIDGPKAEVRIDGEEVRIDGLGEPITLRAGDHVLTVRRGDVEVQTKEFKVRRGDNRVLSVAYEPKAAGPARAAAIPPARLPDGPPGSPLRYLGYVINGPPEAVPEVARYTNLAAIGIGNDRCEALLAAAERAALRVLLGFGGQNRPEAEGRLAPLIRAHRGAVAGVYWVNPYHDGDYTPDDVAAFSRWLKREFPGLQFWAAFPDKLGDREEPLPVPGEVDAIVVVEMNDADPEAVRRKADDCLPGWKAKAGRRPVLLAWHPGLPDLPGLVPRCAPGTMRALVEAAKRHGLAGVNFGPYGTGAEGGTVGLESREALVEEVRQLARELGFAAGPG
jgi:predicted Ser/Thr protein kinase